MLKESDNFKILLSKLISIMFWFKIGHDHTYRVLNFGRLRLTYTKKRNTRKHTHIVL